MANKETTEEEYDPYTHRVVQNPLSNCDALINIVKSVIGTGILAMPMAFYCAGWANAFVSAIVISIILCYAMHIMFHDMYTICKWERVPVLPFPEALSLAFLAGPTCVHCFSGPARVFSDIFISIYHFANCCVYLVFVAENVKQVVDRYAIHLDNRLYMAALLIPVILILLIRDLKALVPISACANILLLVGCFVVLYYVFAALPPFNYRPVQEVRLYPFFFGVMLFSVTAFGLFLLIEANMAKPKDYLGFTGVMNRGLLIITIANCTIGFFGYWRYGEDAKSSITLNIPEDEIMPQIVKIMFAIAIYFSIALQGLVTVDILCTKYFFKMVAEERHFIVNYSVRVCIGLLIVVFAVAIPNLKLFLALVGCLFGNILSTTFPAIMNLCVQYKLGYGKCKIYLLRDIFLFLFGIIGTTVGIMSVINELVTDYPQ